MYLYQFKPRSCIQLKWLRHVVSYLVNRPMSSAPFSVRQEWLTKNTSQLWCPLPRPSPLLAHYWLASYRTNGGVRLVTPGRIIWITWAYTGQQQVMECLVREFYTSLTASNKAAKVVNVKQFPKTVPPEDVLQPQVEQDFFLAVNQK